jgi:hydrogenase maturation factor
MTANSTQALPAGKLPADLLERLLADARRDDPSVLIAPRLGEDGCAILPGHDVLVAATDPITLAGNDIGSYAVWVNANDVAVMGATPRWFLATILLPLGTTEDEVANLFDAMLTALDCMGARLVGGHTEITEQVRQPVIVGQMLGTPVGERPLATGDVRADERIVQIGPAPVEAAAILAEHWQALAERRRSAEIGAALLRRAARAVDEPGISVVQAALTAARLGASAMHDPTEGGLSSGLYELARAGGLVLELSSEHVLWFDPGVQLCRACGLDPWGAIASGTVIASFAPEIAGSAIASLGDAGFTCHDIGFARAPHAGESPTVLVDGEHLREFSRDEIVHLSDSG